MTFPEAELPELVRQRISSIKASTFRIAQSSRRYGEVMAEYYENRIGQILREWIQRGQRGDDRELRDQFAGLEQEAFDATTRAAQRWDASLVLKAGVPKDSALALKTARKKVAPPTPEEIESRDLNRIQKVLWKYRYLPEGASLVKDEVKDTGRAGHSRVYFLRPSLDEKPYPCKGVLLVAKCDIKERADKEMRRIGELRFLQLPPQIALPINELSFPQDGVILYRTLDGTVKLESFLQQQSRSNIGNCLFVLTRLHDSLDYLHQHTQEHTSRKPPNESLRWHHFFPKFLDHDYRETLRKRARGAWVGVAWPSDAKSVALQKVSPGRRFPNPFAACDKWPSDLEKIDKPPRVSRVHGDLNLSNILVVPSPGRHPIDIFLIDLADAEPDQLTAKDYAVLEAEFWREVFSKTLEGEGNPNLAVSQFLWIRDFLEGRCGDRVDADVFTRNSRDFVQKLRELARERLSLGRTGYLLDDYFRCLFYVSLGALAFDSVQKSPLQKRISILAASLCLEALEDWEGGNYTGEVEQGKLPLRRKDDE